MRRLSAVKTLQIAFALAVAVGIVATRTEKLFAEMQSSFHHDMGLALSTVGHNLPEPFDPARVPPSGGMAARLLAGISVKLA